VDLPIAAAEPQKNPVLESRVIKPRAPPLQGRKNVKQAVVGTAGQSTHPSGVSTRCRQMDLIQQQLHLEKALVEGLSLHNTRNIAAQQHHQPTPLKDSLHDIS
jgi:hypothetical protein